MEATQAALEGACRALQNPATRREAEQVVLEFRQSSKPLPACMHVVQHSAVLEARFHAALTIRVATLNEWALISGQERSDLRLWLLKAVLQPAVPDSRHVVTKALIAAYATLVKRGWLEVDEQQQDAIMQEVYGVVSAGAASPMLTTGFQLLEALAAEFCPQTASSMAMPWGFHDECRGSFQKRHLIVTCQHALSAGAGLSLESQRPALTGVMSARDFGGSALPTHGASEPTSIAPGAAWRETLLQPAAMDWLLHLLRAIGRDAAIDKPLESHVRGLLVQLCSLVGEVFPDDDADQAKRRHVAQCATGIMHIVLPVDTLVSAANTQWADEPLLDACKALHALAHNHGLADLQWGLGDALPDFLRAVTHLTHGCIASGGASPDLVDEWQGQGTGLLLESWTSLLQRQERGSPEARAIGPELTACTAAAYQTLMDAYMRDLAAGATEDDEDEAAQDAGRAWSEEVLARIAALGRACLPVSMPAQVAAFQQCMDTLQHAQATELQGLQAMEQLWWLLQLCACTLADSGEGETPQVPGEIIDACESDSGAAVLECIGKLGRYLVQVASLITVPGQQQRCSPRLMEASVWALARYVDTYVMPEYALPEACEALGFSGDAGALLDQCVQVVTACSTQLPGEQRLHKLCVTRLLYVLVNRNRRSQAVWQQPAWQALCTEFSAFSGATVALHSTQQRKLAHCLCTAAAHSFQESPPSEARTFLHQLLGPTCQHVSALAAAAAHLDKRASRETAGRADVVDKMSCALERIRGSIQGARASSTCAIFDTLHPLLKPLTRVQVLYAHNSVITALLFKLAADLVDTQIGCLAADKAQVLARWCLCLLQQYRAAVEQQGDFGVAHNDPSDQRTSEIASQLKALLTLLMNLTQRFDDDITATLAEVVLEGMNIMLPLLTDSLLQHPKVARTYYQLLLQLCETHTPQVAALPPSHFTPLMHSLDWGLAQADVQLISQCLGALGELATFHYHEARAGRPGLSAHSPPEGGTVLVHFLRLILQQLLKEVSPHHVMEAAADALLPMILSEPDSFVLTGEALVATQHEGDVRAALTSQLGTLMQGLGDQTLSRQHRARFKTQLQSFVANTRGIIYKK